MKIKVYLGPQRVWQWLWLQKGLISFTSEHEHQEIPGPCSLGHRKLCPEDEQNQGGYVVETLGLNSMAKTEGVTIVLKATTKSLFSAK